MTLQRKKVGESTITLSDAKNYMRFAGDERDDEIQTILKSAIALVEDRQNVSLRPQTIELRLSGGGWRDLYLHPVSRVISARNAYSGDELEFKHSYDKRSVNVSTTEPYVVEYETAADDATIASYKPAVLVITALIFDGITETEAFRKAFNTYLIPKFL